MVLKILTVVSRRSFIDIPPAFQKECTASFHSFASALFGLFFCVPWVGSDFCPEEVSAAEPCKGAKLVCAVAEYITCHQHRLKHSNFQYIYHFLQNRKKGKSPEKGFALMIFENKIFLKLC